MEEYRKVPGYSGRYLVSESGTVFTMKRKKILCAHADRAGYLRVRLSMNSEVRSHSVSRLVAECFVPGRSRVRNTVNHKDGNKSNNHFSNLEWCSQSENNKHAIQTGLRKIRRGEDNGMARWSEGDIKEIRRMYKTGKYRQKDIAKIFDCTQSQVSKITRRDLWAHVT